MLCLSGGKDSFGLLKVLHGFIEDKTYDIDLHVYTLDQSQPGWDGSQLRKYLDNLGVSYEIETKNTYGVVIIKFQRVKPIVHYVLDFVVVISTDMQKSIKWIK